jgi:hypothetical protein
MGLTTLGDRNALSYKDNDIDSDGDGTVNDSDKYDGTSPSDGTNGQLLQTDGTTTSWQSISSKSAEDVRKDAVIYGEYSKNVGGYSSDIVHVNGTVALDGSNTVFENITIPSGELYFVDKLHITTNGSAGIATYGVDVAVGDGSYLTGINTLGNTGRGAGTSIDPSGENGATANLGVFASAGESVVVKEHDENGSQGEVFYSLSLRRVENHSDQSSHGLASIDSNNSTLVSKTVPSGEVWYISNVYGQSDGSASIGTYSTHLGVGDSAYLDTMSDISQSSRGRDISIDPSTNGSGELHTVESYAMPGEEIRLVENGDNGSNGQIGYGVEIRRVTPP